MIEISVSVIAIIALIFLIIGMCIGISLTRPVIR